jgi:hypothetical protein
MLFRRYGVIEKLYVGVSPLPLDYVLEVQKIKGERSGEPLWQLIGKEV